MKEITLQDQTKAIVSEDDADTANLHWWKTNGYASRTFAGKLTYLHRVVLERVIGRPLVKGEYADHINRDTLDNRRENLRVANGSESTRNRNKQANTTSRYIGVVHLASSSKRKKLWRAYIKVDGNNKTVGYFTTEKEAAQARDKASKQFYGEFARLNNV